MSIHHLTCAAELNMPASKKLAFMAICDAADKETGLGYPGLDAIMQWSNLQKRRALIVIGELIEEGYLARVEQGRIGRRAVYRVFDRIPCCPMHAPKEGAFHDTLSSEEGAQEGAQEGAPQSAPLPYLPDTPSRRESEAAVAPSRRDVSQILDLLDSEIERNGSRRPSRTRKNVDAARLLIDRDGRSVPDIEAVIRWCQQDEFWRSNILSMSKLREKFDRLRLDMQRSPRSADHRRMQNNLGLVQDYGQQQESPWSTPAIEDGGR